ncbi:MAG: recombinase family protein [Gammaproteobacteria bacterium]|nr:recombinase family protein [Gammaproteobacteria bacterium]
MLMTNKIQSQHLEKPAYIYLRQSTMGQVLHHQESTERQYALKDKALSLGWSLEQVRILDQDLGISGTQSHNRDGFKILVADVSMNKVGAVISLEASRLSRSNSDWHRLVELCSLTNTLIIDEDGCYDPADFNDRLLLGIKGTISQAELHFIRARLQGGKDNKAQKGELRFPLPVGFCYDPQQLIVLDPDQQVQAAVRLLFESFKETGSAYGVVHYFRSNDLKFPKRAYGGTWDGSLIWGNLAHSRVLNVIRNPSYAGAYVYGRYQQIHTIDKYGNIQTKVTQGAQSSWKVLIKEHHEAYITWDEYNNNKRLLAKNRTNTLENQLPGPAREGLAMLQGLLVCGHCGHKVTVRYTGLNGIYPCYLCSWKRRDGLSAKDCFSIRGDTLDKAISQRILEIIEPLEIKLAIESIEELAKRNGAVDKQWLLRLQRAEYDTQLCQRRYEAVDPANRLVATTLENNWNNALTELHKIREQYEAYQTKNNIVASNEQKEKILALAQDLPHLWTAPSTCAKDKKRILRLLIKDITINVDKSICTLHIRWQGGATETIRVNKLQKSSDKWRHSKETIDKVRTLALTMNDKQIAAALNNKGLITNKGNPFTESGIQWIRYKHSIPAVSQQKNENELTVKEVANKFHVSTHVVYYWIERKVIIPRRLTPNSPYRISLNIDKEQELLNWVQTSSRIKQHS